jgi:hypothetical protein
MDAHIQLRFLQPATVVNFAEYKAARTIAQAGVEDRRPLPSRRSLPTPRAIAHRRRMLRHLGANVPS